MTKTRSRRLSAFTLNRMAVSAAALSAGFAFTQGEACADHGLRHLGPAVAEPRKCAVKIEYHVRGARAGHEARHQFNGR